MLKMTKNQQIKYVSAKDEKLHQATGSSGDRSCSRHVESTGTSPQCSQEDFRPNQVQELDDVPIDVYEEFIDALFDGDPQVIQESSESGNKARGTGAKNKLKSNTKKKQEQEIPKEETSTLQYPFAHERVLKSNIIYEKVINAAYKVDVGTCELLTEHVGNILFKDLETNKWYIFEGPSQGWIEDSGCKRYGLLRTIAGFYEALEAQVGDMDDKRAKTLVQHCFNQCKRIYSAKLSRDIMEYAGKSTDYLGRIGIKWDEAKYTVPFQDCIFDIRTKQSRDYGPNDYYSKKVPFSYDKDATCPRFTAALQDGLGKEKFGFVQEFYGYALCRDPKEEKTLILNGLGGNGKGLQDEVVSAAMGDLAGSMDISDLLKKGNSRNSGGPSPEKIALNGKALVVATEPEHGTIFGSELLRLTGHDSSNNRLLYSNKVITSRPSYALVIEANQIPHVRTGDNSYKRRLIVVECPIKYVEHPDPNKPNEHKIDTGLKNYVIANELPGVMNWLIEGAYRWYHGSAENGYQSKLIIPPSVLKDTEAFWSDEDDMQCFIENYLIVEAKPEQKDVKNDNYHCSAIYDKYKEYCEIIGSKSMSLKSFSIDIRNRLGIKSSSRHATRDKEGMFFANEGQNYPCVVLKSDEITM